MGSSLPKEGKIEQEHIPKHTHMEMAHVHIRQIKIEPCLKGCQGSKKTKRKW